MHKVSRASLMSRGWMARGLMAEFQGSAVPDAAERRADARSTPAPFRRERYGQRGHTLR
jgi:hypothetical protein